MRMVPQVFRTKTSVMTLLWFVSIASYAHAESINGKNFGFYHLLPVRRMACKVVPNKRPVLGRLNRATIIPAKTTFTPDSSYVRTARQSYTQCRTQAKKAGT